MCLLGMCMLGPQVRVDKDLGDPYEDPEGMRVAAVPRGWMKSQEEIPVIYGFWFQG